MRVALVHDWLTGMRGGERVLEELCGLFPDASVFTLFHRPGSVSRRIESMPIHTSFLNRIPGAQRHYPYLLPLYPFAISQFNFSGFDLILSVSHAAAKGIHKPAGSTHICYCLTPMRYLWDMKSDYFQYADTLGLKRAALSVVSYPLRHWDRTTARRVTYFIADSLHVRDRISKYYGRAADIIYPPVDTDFFTPSANGRSHDFYLMVSALVPYKRVDIAIDAFNALGYPLIIVGAGPDREKLRGRAASNIEFKGFVSNDELRNLYRHSRGVVITAREDFGLVSLEAQACGRPPIAYGAGGSLESVTDGHTGILFYQRTVDGLIEGVHRLESVEFEPEQLRKNAEQFSRQKFRESLMQSIMEKCSPTRRSFSSAIRKETCEAPAAHPSVAGLPGILKRIIDVVLAAAGLFVTAFPLIWIALFIRLTSRGPALFIQARLGLAGKSFTMYKLRTMYVDAERHGATWAVENDPRCTRLGAYLRRFGVDELPQLWNVLVGDMSMVGPRPERPEFHKIFLTDYPEYARRLQVRGGISGLAQIRGWRGNTSIRGRLHSDLEYIAHWSLWKDLLILCATPAALCRRQSRSLHQKKIEESRTTAGY